MMRSRRRGKELVVQSSRAFPVNYYDDSSVSREGDLRGRALERNGAHRSSDDAPSDDAPRSSSMGATKARLRIEVGQLRKPWESWGATGKCEMDTTQPRGCEDTFVANGVFSEGRHQERDLPRTTGNSEQQKNRLWPLRVAQRTIGGPPSPSGADSPGPPRLITSGALLRSAGGRAPFFEFSPQNFRREPIRPSSPLRAPLTIGSPLASRDQGEEASAASLLNIKPVGNVPAKEEERFAPGEESARDRAKALVDALTKSDSDKEAGEDVRTGTGVLPTHLQLEGRPQEPSAKSDRLMESWRPVPIDASSRASLMRRPSLPASLASSSVISPDAFSRASLVPPARWRGTEVAQRLVRSWSPPARVRVGVVPSWRDHRRRSLLAAAISEARPPRTNEGSAPASGRGTALVATGKGEKMRQQLEKRHDDEEEVEQDALEEEAVIYVPPPELLRPATLETPLFHSRNVLAIRGCTLNGVVGAVPDVVAQIFPREKWGEYTLPSRVAHHTRTEIRIPGQSCARTYLAVSSSTAAGSATAAGGAASRPVASAFRLDRARTPTPDRASLLTASYLHLGPHRRSFALLPGGATLRIQSSDRAAQQDRPLNTKSGYFSAWPGSPLPPRE